MESRKGSIVSGWRITGQNVRGIPWLGVWATGREMTIRAVTVDSVVDGVPQVARVRNRPYKQAVLRWALRGSNPRPSPCKGDALPAELSARLRGVTARSTDHIAELDRQARSAARGAPV